MDRPGSAEGGQQLSLPSRALPRRQRNAKLPFPWKVYEMLENVDKEGLSNIVSWLPHGKSFRVHKEKEFVSDVMPKYFNQSKFTSFTRQLYIYGFQKMPDGPDKGSFIHPKFIKEDKNLCLTMKRNNTNTILKNQADSRTISDEDLRASLTDVEPTGGENRFKSQDLMSQVNRLSCHLQQQDSSSSHQPFLGSARVFQQLLSTQGNLLSQSPLSGHASLPTTMNSNSLTNSSVFFSNIPYHTGQGTAEGHGQVQERIDEDWLAKYERLTSHSLPPSRLNNVQSRVAASQGAKSIGFVSDEGNSTSLMGLSVDQLRSVASLNRPALNNQTHASHPLGRGVLVGNQLTGDKTQQKIHWGLANGNLQPTTHHNGELRHRQSVSEPSKAQGPLNGSDQGDDFGGRRFDFFE